jgi:Spy/CpxP family protein refolding chaperone
MHPHLKDVYIVRLLLTALVAMLVLSIATAQNKDKDKDKGTKETGTKSKGRLPPEWSKIIRLNSTQQKKIREIDQKAQDEIAKLNEQIRQIRLKARQEQLAVLMPEQRKMLREGPDGKR